jgi:hypothetical protein
MDYFSGLDISMDETHICVLDREGAVVRESKTASTAEAIAGELSKAPSCRRIVFETGRMAPILFHGLNQLGLPVVCVESRQAYHQQPVKKETRRGRDAPRDAWSEEHLLRGHVVEHLSRHLQHSEKRDETQIFRHWGVYLDSKLSIRRRRRSNRHIQRG